MIKSILSFIVLLFSLGFAFFYVKPEYSKGVGDQANLTKLQQTLSDAKGIEVLIKSTQANLNKIGQNDIANFDVFLPEAIDEIRFANNLQGIGLSTGVILSDIKVLPKDKNDKTTTTASALGDINTTNSQVSDTKYATTKTSFTFVTDYASFLNFTSALEKSLGLINVTALTFKEVPRPASANTAKKAGTSPMIFQFSMQIETYSFK